MTQQLKSDYRGMFRDGDIEGVFVKKMETYADNRGWLGELFRKDDPSPKPNPHRRIRRREQFYPAMSYISITNPDVVRGPHEHREQTDYFCFLGKFKLYLWDNRKDSPTHKNKKIFENADRLIVVVPPGVVHAYKNTGEKDAIVLNFLTGFMEDGTKKKRLMKSDMKMMLRVHLRLSNSGQGSILSLILEAIALSRLLSGQKNRSRTIPCPDNRGSRITMKILVTGGCGFIGSNFIRYILNKYPDYEIVNIDALTYAGNLENLRDIREDKRYRFVHGRIEDKNLVANALGDADYIVNFAAETHVDRSIRNSSPF